METDRERAHRAWRNAERIKRLSDRLVTFGPLGIGLDGVLAWVPGANFAYSLGAGGLLIFEGIKAQAEAATLARMAIYIGLNSALSDFPVVGWTLNTFFPGHLLASRALQRDIQRRHGLPDEVAAAGGRWRPFAGFGRAFGRGARAAA